MKKFTHLSLFSLIICLLIGLPSFGTPTVTVENVFVGGSPGCTDEEAENYNPDAFVDDGSCYYNSECDVFVDADGNGYGFFSYYNPENWTFENSDGDGSIEHMNESLNIVGSNSDEAIDPITQVTISASATGIYSFDWYYYTEDESADYDVAYYINGVRVDLTEFDGGFNQNGVVSFEANEGDLIGFGIDATDDCCGAGFLEVTNFRYPFSCIGTCFVATADNYNPNGDYDDFESCIWTNECGDETDSNGNGSFFSGEFAVDAWTEVSEGNGSLDFFTEEDGSSQEIQITGSNEDLGTDVNTGWTIIAPVSGTYSFGWNYDTEDETSVNDPAYYYHNEMVIITEEFDQFGDPIGSGSQSGWIQFEVEAGDEIGFGILSNNDCCGEAYLYIYSFAWPINCEGGCMDETALNYNPEADFDNEWCAFMNDCEVMVNTNGDAINFAGDFAPELWEILSEGDGLVQIEEDQMEIWGSDTNDEGNSVLTQATIEVPVDGTYTFDWTYFTIDGSSYDIAYFINDTRTDLTLDTDGEGGYFGNSGQSGTVSLELTAGTILGFGMEAVDDCCGLGTLTINHFIHPAAFCAAGCTEEGACNFDPEANFNDGSCDFETCAGCTDPTACNYDEEATIDNDSCDFESCAGCMDETALNYDSEATIDSEDCIYDCVLPEVTFETSGCDQSEFSVEISIASIGNGAPYVISNSFDDTTEMADEAGDISYGSFPTDETVIITIVSSFGEVCEISSDELGCTNGIEENESANLVVYPNPANSMITIGADINELVQIQLFDVTGRLVMSQSTVLTSQGFTCNVSEFAEGSYVVNITSGNGNLTERIVIQH